MALLLDTQVLVWVARNDARLPARVRQRLQNPDEQLLVSGVTAWEFVDLEARRRLPEGVSFPVLINQLEAELVDCPARAWTIIRSLSQLHLDRVDRMVIAHALADGFTLVTGDATMRRYPVASFW